MACPKCGASYAEEPAISEPVIAGINLDVTHDVVRLLAKYIFGGLSIVTAIGVIQLAVQLGALWNAGMTRLHRLLNQRIDAEFRTERITQSGLAIGDGAVSTGARLQLADCDSPRFLSQCRARSARRGEGLEEEFCPITVRHGSNTERACHPAAF